MSGRGDHYVGRNPVQEVQESLPTYYETPNHEISFKYVEGYKRLRSQSLLPNFVMFEAHIVGQLRTFTKSGRSRMMRLDSHNYERLYERLKNRADHFVITVGVLDDTKMHDNVFGYSDISYGLLFDLLKSVGYDPLYPIRKESFIKTMERKFGDIVLKSINKRNPDDTRTIKAKLQHAAMGIVDFVRDYIASGDKPFLSQKTIRTRGYKDTLVDGLYPNGIDEPLSESGQLEESIECDVEAYETQDKKDYFDKIEEAKKKAKRKRDKIIAEKKKARTKRRAESPYDQVSKMLDTVSDYETRIANIERNLSTGKVQSDFMYMTKSQLSDLKIKRDLLLNRALAFANKKGIVVEFQE